MPFRHWLLLCFLLTCHVVSAQALECGARPLRLAFYENGLYYFRDAQGQARGIDPDLVQEMQRRSGCRIETMVMARARIWADLESGALDMATSGIQTPERDRFAWFIHYQIQKNHAVIRRSLQNQVKQPQDFINDSKLIFGVVRGYKHGEQQDKWLEPLRAAGRVQESPEIEIIFKKLKENRIDAMYAPAPLYHKKLADLGFAQDVMIQDWAPQTRGVMHGMILSKKSFAQPEVAAWRKILQEMRKDGSIKRIFLRYLPPEETQRLLDMPD
ncbi:transporter substrate-binding domain-containing protein [Massilia sp. W12]|uniref:substrate-binding periplasmic protein n=1 Tax=Massilia sp. W12 TaxID=3126507 RepID=UPI0030D1C5B5